MELPESTFLAWAFNAQLEYSRIESDTVRQLLDGSEHVATEATSRMAEIKEAYPINMNDYGKDLNLPPRREAVEAVISAFVSYMATISDALSTWSPDSREFPNMIPIEPILMERFGEDAPSRP